MLDNEGVLDSLVQEIEEYSDGTKVFGPTNTPAWFVDGKVDRAWMYNQWTMGEATLGCHHAE